LSESRSTPLYTLREDYPVHSAGESWAFTLTNMDRPLAVVIYGDDDSVVATRNLSMSASGTIDVVAIVSIPGSIQVRSFRIVDDGTSLDGGETTTTIPATARLVGVSTSPPSGASPLGVTESDGFLVVGHGSGAGTWRGGEDGSVSWSVFPDAESWSLSAPVEITYRYDPIRPGTPGDPRLVPSVDLNVGRQVFNLKLRPGQNRVVVYPEIYDARASEITVRSEVDGFTVLSIVPAEAEDTPTPLPADLGTVLSYDPVLWRTDEFELFRWTLFPGILVMDTRNYAVQSRFFKRLAFFAEKEGFRGQILSDDELSGWHGYNAHNYSGEGLAAFFNAAQDAGVQLTAEENLLRRIVEHEGIVLRSGGRFEPGPGGILSISQESLRTPGLRRLLLTHEAYHGVYYADAAYVDQISELWQSLSDDERRFWRLFLDGMQYAVGDPSLVQNEFHAYLLQQPVLSARWYFEEHSADRLRSWKPQEAAWLNRFLTENGGTFGRQASAANEILHSLTGLTGGNVFCLELTTP